MLNERHYRNRPSFDPHGLNILTGASVSAVRTDRGEPDQSLHPLSGWWIVPVVILGLGMWVIIIRAALAWLA